MRLLRQRSSFLWNIVADPLAAQFSNFLAFGFDVRDADPWRHKSLIRRLRTEGEHEGARFELQLLAAFRRAGIPCEYEPFSGTGGRNPDFVLNLGESIAADAKLARESSRVLEEREWFETITLARDLLDGWRPLPPLRFQIELTESFRTRQDSEDGRRWIRDNAARLAEEVRRLRDRLSLEATLPSEGEVEGFVRVRALHPDDRSGGHHMGVGPDGFREAARVVRRHMADGAGQIPSTMRGLVVLRVDWNTSPATVAQEVERWLDEEGEAYSSLLGAVVLSRGVIEGETTTVETVLPVWRKSIQGPWRDEVAWQRFACGLNWRELALLQWQAATNVSVRR